MFIYLFFYDTLCVSFGKNNANTKFPIFFFKCNRRYHLLARWSKYQMTKNMWKAAFYCIHCPLNISDFQSLNYFSSFCVSLIYYYGSKCLSFNTRFWFAIVFPSWQFLRCVSANCIRNFSNINYYFLKMLKKFSEKYFPHSTTRNFMSYLNINHFLI